MKPPGDAVNETTGPPYQRPGKLGVDYDPYGEEMAPNARIWRKYVEETDKMDKELVDGWNKTLDVILIFAALFSAILTAFVLESSKDLKPDPTDASAQTLLLISQTLLTMSTGSKANNSLTASADPPGFTPAHSAVIVNVLWFMSLGLSISVTLIAILAKEWCYAFMAGRVGPMLKQGRLRQQRWDGIEQWKMKEMLYVLPLLMHIALLLFAIGLSVYLWNINVQVAIPIIVVTTLTTLFYVVTVSLPLFFRYCPYRTALAGLVVFYLIAVLERSGTKTRIKQIIALKLWLYQEVERLKQLLPVWLARPNNQAPDPENIADTFTFLELVEHYDVQAAADRFVQQIRERFGTDRSQLIEKKTPMDNITSSMLSWMITHCEDSNSIDMAVQALSGADLRLLPREPLWKCDTIEVVRQRLRFCLDTLYSTSSGFEQDRLVEYASLYSRSLRFLTSCIPDGLIATGLPLDRSDGFNSMLYSDSHLIEADGIGCIVHRFDILRHCLELASLKYEIAAFELNNVPLQLYSHQWDLLDGRRKQCSMQWKFLKQIIAGQVNLSPSAVLALVNAIAKTYLHQPSQPPAPLMELLNITSRYNLTTPQEWERRQELRRAIAIALTVAVFANNDYTPSVGGRDSASDTRLARARSIYKVLTMRKAEEFDGEYLLLFGLLGLLHNPIPSWNLNSTDIKLVGIALNGLWLGYAASPPYHSIISALPPDLVPGVPPEPWAHFALVLSDLLKSDLSEEGGVSEFGISCIDALLSSNLCGRSGEHITPILTAIWSLKYRVG